METKDILKLLRKKSGYNSAQDFCNAVDLSFNTYQNYESGKRIPTAEILMKLADFYGVTTDYLLGRDSGVPEPVEQLERQFNMSLLERKILEEYLALPEKLREDLMSFLERAVREVSEQSKTPNIKHENYTAVARGGDTSYIPAPTEDQEAAADEETNADYF